jgi:excisionase family DNA binding protein
MSATSVSMLPPLDERQRYTIPETAAYLRVCRAYVYVLMQRGELQSITDGSRRYVPGTEIIRRSTLSPA